MQTRTIDLLELARDGGCVEGEVEAAQLPRLSGMLAAPMGRIRYRLQGQIDEQGRSGANLDIEAHLGLRCDHCGEHLDWTLNESERFFFVEDEAQLGAAPITADGDEPLLATHRFDLLDLVEEQTMLGLPMSPRHPQCAQRPSEQQDPGTTGTTRPFAALAGLKRGRGDIQ